MTIQPTELSAAVRGAIAEVLGVDPGELSDSTDLRTEYGIDSLELMSVGANLERALDVRIEADDLIAAENVGHATALLAARIGVVA